MAVHQVEAFLFLLSKAQDHSINKPLALYSMPLPRNQKNKSCL